MGPGKGRMAGFGRWGGNEQRPQRQGSTTAPQPLIRASRAEWPFCPVVWSMGLDHRRAVGWALPGTTAFYQLGACLGAAGHSDMCITHPRVCLSACALVGSWEPACLSEVLSPIPMCPGPCMSLPWSVGSQSQVLRP